MILRYNTSNGGVAQGLEQRAHNLLVVGSIPTAPTILDLADCPVFWLAKSTVRD